ncbi:helix-turn-helix domain-containing protein [Clostridium sp. MCC353]|uniref:AraC family transcriptional regulator n=1 Tax=Clostridium sp. MCC353 TaxID=2592646 RepID=UPI001C0242D9|nr:AraC family transcriptional regulator [Clostridium sp. MCC353]MBT9778653.1 helix-turn-helix domain-containing protein [Clostridium sp. MCC353]
MRTKHLPRAFQPIFHFSIALFFALVLVFGTLDARAVLKSKKEMKQMQVLTLEQSCQNIEYFLYGAMRCDLIFQKNSKLGAYNISKNRAYPHNIIRELNLLQSYISSLKSLGFVYTSSPYEEINHIVYTDAGVYSGDSYLSLQCESSLPYDTLLDSLQGIDGPCFLTDGIVSPKYLLYAMPIFPEDLSSPGYLLFLLNRNEFIKPFSDLVAKYGGDIYFFDPFGDLFLYSGTSFQTFYDAKQSLADGFDYAGADRDEHFEYTSDLYSFTAFQSVPKSTFYASLNASIYLLLGICASSLIFGIAILMIITSHSAKPLNTLVEGLRIQEGLPDDSASCGNEFDQIASSFQNLLSQQKSLAQTVVAHAQMEEEQYILFLMGLSGATSFSDGLLEKYNCLFSDPDRKFCVCIFRFDNAQTISTGDLSCLQSRLHESFAAECLSDGYGIMASLPGSLANAALCFLPGDVDEYHFICTVRENLQQKFCLQLSCSISSIVKRKEFLPHAYRNAIKSFRYSIFLPNCCIRESDIEQLDMSNRSSSSQISISALIQAINSCNHTEIANQCANFFSQVMKRSSLADYKIAYFDLMAQLSKTIQKCPASEREVLFYQLETLYEDFYVPPEYLEKKVYDLCCILANTIYQSQNTILSSSLETAILNYIDQHYTSPDLTLDVIAQALSFSPSYLTRYFKEKQGVSLMQFIDQKRFSKSKQLLVETKLSVKEIREQCGYTDAANFSRKFRQNEGITPKQYRMLHGRKSEDEI